MWLPETRHRETQSGSFPSHCQLAPLKAPSPKGLSPVHTRVLERAGRAHQGEPEAEPHVRLSQALTLSLRASKAVR